MLIYGLQIVSDIPFPLHLPHRGEHRETIHLTSAVPDMFFSKELLYCERYLHTSHECRIHLYSSIPIEEMTHGTALCYEAEDTVRFYWVYGSRHIYYQLLERGDAARLAFWFIHMFFPLYLTMENIFKLMHCSAVEIEGRTVLFTAPYKTGKSTLADYFLKQGHDLITDDILPTFMENGKPMCYSSFPYFRPFRETETLGYHTKRFHPSRKSIDTIYVLQNSEEGEQIDIAPCKGVEKFIRLKKNGIVYTFDFMNLSHDKHLFKLLEHTNVFTITRPWGKQHLPPLYQAIITHQKGMI